MDKKKMERQNKHRLGNGSTDSKVMYYERNGRR